MKQHSSVVRFQMQRPGNSSEIRIKIHPHQMITIAQNLAGIYKQGNPHLDINRVLALWKASVDDDAMKNWVNVDLTPPPVAAEPADAVAATE
jgi:hypothetical protein